MKGKGAIGAAGSLWAGFTPAKGPAPAGPWTHHDTPPAGMKPAPQRRASQLARNLWGRVYPGQRPGASRPMDAPRHSAGRHEAGPTKEPAVAGLRRNTTSAAGSR